MKPSKISTWETQAVKFMTSKKVNIDFCLQELSVTKIVASKCHLDDYTNSRYNMILGRDVLTSLGLYLKFFEKHHHWW